MFHPYVQERGFYAWDINSQHWTGAEEFAWVMITEERVFGIFGNQIHSQGTGVYSFKVTPFVS